MSSSQPEDPPTRAERSTRGAERRRPSRRRWAERGWLAVGLVASVLIHILVIVVADLWLDGPPRPPYSPPESDQAVEPEGMRAVELAVAEEPPVGAPEAELPIEPEPEPEPEPDDRAEDEPEPAAEDEEAAAAIEAAEEAARRAALSAADRLRPRVGDPRVWITPSDPAPPDSTDEEIVHARLAERLQRFNDSISAAIARETAEWIYTDEDGGRWGISEGQLHLGDVTLPLPIYFPTSPQAAARDREWRMIQHQAARAAAQAYFEERVKAIRERRERERRQSGNGSNDSDP